jgi:hypothetical protein
MAGAQQRVSKVVVGTAGGKTTVDGGRRGVVVRRLVNE